MISNYEFLIQNYSNLLSYPLLVSILPIIAGGIVYLLGKIRSSNYWQYHLDNKYVPFLHGIIVINNFIFIPLLILFLIYFTLFDRNMFTNYGFLSVVALIIVLNIIQNYGKKLITWKKKVLPNTENNLINVLNIINELFENWKEYLRLFLLKRVFPVLLYLSMFFALKNTENRLVLFLVGFVWLLALMFFALTDKIIEQHKTYDLILKNKKRYENVQIIEFLNDGKLMKYQDEKLNMKFIPVERISEIIMIKGG